jgi:3-hydroxybutyryl-CoA dehydratase
MNDPANYSFDELKIGLCESFELQITESMVNDFAKISGDLNPLHMDSKYAESTKFGKKICHGMLLASLFSRLIGMHIPGKKSLYFSQTLNFLEPCYIDDNVIVKGELLDKSMATKILTIKTSISNSEKCLVDGIAQVMLLK